MLKYKHSVQFLKGNVMKADNSKQTKLEVANNNILIAGMSEINELLKKIINKMDDTQQEISAINKINKKAMNELNEIKDEMKVFLKMDVTETNNYFKEEMQKVKNPLSDRNTHCEINNDNNVEELKAFEKYFGSK